VWKKAILPGTQRVLLYTEEEEEEKEEEELREEEEEKETKDLASANGVPPQC